MKKKRVFALFLLLMGGFCGLQLRLFWLMSDSAAAREAVEQQAVDKLRVASVRPGIYDRHGQCLTEGESIHYAVAVPSQLIRYSLEDFMPVQERARLYALQEQNHTLPEVFRLKKALPGYMPAKQVELKTRYSDDGVLSHIVGYLDGDGNGVCGIEKAFNSYLSENTGTVCAKIEVDAVGRAGDTAFTVTELRENKAGIHLTIDSAIQQITFNAAKKGFSRGAVVVMDTATGEILASVSLPSYSQKNPSEFLQKDYSPFINRAFSNYNAGSVFKPVVAAAAIESGFADFRYECTGSIETGGVQFSCNAGTAHGEVDMELALQQSCNCYFVALGREMGAENLYSMADAARIGHSCRLGGEIQSDGGKLPSLETLQDSTQLANLCFGQGLLLVTPLQVAAYTAAIANGGEYCEPKLVARVGDSECEPGIPTRIMGEETAEIITGCLIAAVAEGTGRPAALAATAAAGKTGTAETGGGGVIGWFSGFFPADEPRYAVTVMAEGEGYGYAVSAPVFAEIAREILALEASRLG